MANTCTWLRGTCCVQRSCRNLFQSERSNRTQPSLPLGRSNCLPMHWQVMKNPAQLSQNSIEDSPSILEQQIVTIPRVLKAFRRSGSAGHSLCTAQRATSTTPHTEKSRYMTGYFPNFVSNRTCLAIARFFNKTFSRGCRASSSGLVNLKNLW